MPLGNMSCSRRALLNVCLPLPPAASYPHPPMPLRAGESAGHGLNPHTREQETREQTCPPSRVGVLVTVVEH